MGEKVRKRAERLGLIKLRPTILYGRPKKIRRMASKGKPDIADAIRDYMRLLDPNSVEDSSMRMKSMSVTYYSIAPQANLYVEVLLKIAGLSIKVKPVNWALQISIFSDNNEHIRGIANAVNQIWEDKILAHIDWKIVEKKYNVKRKDCIAAWNAIIKR